MKIRALIAVELDVFRFFENELRYLEKYRTPENEMILRTQPGTKKEAQNYLSPPNWNSYHHAKRLRLRSKDENGVLTPFSPNFRFSSEPLDHLCLDDE